MIDVFYLKGSIDIRFACSDDDTVARVVVKLVTR